MPYRITAARAARHTGEEPCISGTKGSGTVFFSGCQLKCVYCQNTEISHKKFGKAISPQELSEIFKRLEAEGVHNINLVSPTPYIPLIINAFEIYRPKIPVVFNSGGYELPETLHLLDGVVDIYLLDYKYAFGETAALYSAAADYPQVAKKALETAYSLVGGTKLDENGLLKSGVIVRHLLLPFGTREAATVIKTVADMKIDVLFSLMGQYTVMNGVPQRLKRRVTAREYEKTVAAFLDSGLKGYVQDLDSSDMSFIPAFDLTGIV